MRMLVALLVLLAACVPARKRIAGDVVRNLHFTGNGGLFSGHNDLQLRQQMEQQSSGFGVMLFPLTYFVEPATYVADTLARDAYRLEVWYAHHGFLDARVVGFQARRVRERRKRKAGVVDLRGYVDPGPPSLVRGFQIIGETPSTRVLANLVKRTALQRPGRQFDLDSAELDRGRLENELHRHGYAYATVDLSVDAHPAEHAVDIQLDLEPGIISQFGAVEISGNSAVASKLIAQNLRIVEGEPYRLDELISSQNRLFAMNTFSLVSVKPDLSDPTVRRVPIKVEVTENRFRSLKVGVGLRTSLQDWRPYVLARFRHTHLMHQLIQLNAGARLGLAGFTPFSKADVKIAPTWRFDGALTYPRIFGQRVAQQIEFQIERGLDTNISRFDNPEFDIRTIWRPSDVFVMRMGPHFEIYSYVDLDPNSLANARRVYGQGFDGRYQLTTIDLGVTLDWRDDPITSRRGSFLATTLRYAFPLLSRDDYHFLAFTGDWRLFRPIRIGRDVPLTLATRVHGKLIGPLGDDGLPYPEKVFLGGATSMRGYPNRSLGPYESLTVNSPDPDAPNGIRESTAYLPRGGSFGMVIEEELRYHAANNFTYALFVEGAGLADPFAPEPLPLIVRVAGGLGVRYGSPIGPIRLDLAVRPRYAEDLCPGQPPVPMPGSDAAVACAASNGTPEQRRLDIVRSIDADSRLPAFMVFFAFGEAI